MRSFGLDNPGGSRVVVDNPNRLVDLATQEASLQTLAELVQRATIHPLIRNTAVKIIRSCESREDLCELQAIFDAVKSGDVGVPPLADGLKYIADPRYADYFESPVDMLQQCMKGACGSDCDGHAGLICALAGAVGWVVGLRAYGPRNSQGYSHVYAVALFPKRGPFERAVGMDTTVPSASLGWEPPRGNVLTAWIY